jgi:secreted trypsin-like serine protease
MRLRPRWSAALIGVAIGVTLTMPSAAVAAGGLGGTPQPNIIGGQPVSSAPWSAAVYRSTGSFTCSGTIIAATWVLTARHCVSSGISVRIGNVLRDQGTQVNVLSSSLSPGADLALLRLGRAINTTFSPLGSAHPATGATNSIYGWGRTSQTGPASPQLRTAQVRVTSTNCRDAFGGRAICSNGITGVAWSGDSGGPQYSGGLQVGVASTANGTTSQTYGSVVANRAWIRSVSGV